MVGSVRLMQFSKDVKLKVYRLCSCTVEKRLVVILAASNMRSRDMRYKEEKYDLIVSFTLGSCR